MIDPRNMPCARVCLSRLLPRELPPNAQEQYHNYAIQRKSSLTSLNAAKDTTEVVVSSLSPVDFSCVLGASDQAHTNATSLNVPRDTISDVLTNTQQLPSNGTNGCSASTQSSLSNYSCMPVVNDQVDLKPVNITTNMSTKRRSSVTSLSSSHSLGSSKGREIVASVCLTPVTWKRPRYTTRWHEDCMPETELELSEMSDVTDDSTLSGTESADNFPYCMRKNLKPQDFSYEEMSVTSNLSTTNASEQEIDESRNPSGFASFSDHVMYGCEDMWPDLHCYSPPESPGPQKTETTVLKEFCEDTNALEDPIARTQIEESGKPGRFLYSRHSDVTAEQNRLLSPEVKLVPRDGKEYQQYKRRMPFNESGCKRKSLSPKGNLVVKVEDLREKLKPCASGGLTVVTNSAKERYTSSGRRIANNYSEKELAKLSMVHALNAEKKKRKVRRKVPKGSPQVRKRPNKNPTGKRHNSLRRYENLKFSELNTVPRMSVRYKVAFTKWPYVFSGALDLINQRLVSQNAFWDSVRS